VSGSASTAKGSQFNITNIKY